MLFDKLFGRKSYYGFFPDLSDYESLGNKDVAEFYETSFTRIRPKVFMSGGFNEEHVDVVQKLFCEKTEEKEKQLKIFENNKYGECFRKELKSSRQSFLKIGKLVPPPESDQHVKVFIANILLGGFFGSRLMKRIREQKGISYGISSGIINLSGASTLVISTSLKKGSIDDAIFEIKDEMKLLSLKKIDVDELKMLQNYYIGVLMRSFDGVFSISALYRNSVVEGKKMDYTKRLIKSISEVTPDELKDTFGTFFKPDSFCYVAVD
jgi:predicted Zn-dependent peptidase